MIEKYVTEEQAIEFRKKDNPNRKYLPMGNLELSTFRKDEEIAEDMPMQISLVWFTGGFFKSNQFYKLECPICHKHELVPYLVGGSVLSGSHTIKGCCFNCHKKLAFWDSQYFHFIQRCFIERPLGSKSEIAFASSFKTDVFKNSEEIVDGLFKKMSKSLNYDDTKILKLFISGCQDLSLKEIANIKSVISERFKKEVKIILKTNVKNLSKEYYLNIDLYAYKK